MRWRLTGAAALLVLLGTDCADGPNPARPDLVAPTTTAGLPLENYAGLAPIIDPIVRPLGLRLTRGALADRSTGKASATARHLALYVEPLTTFTDDEFIQTIAPLARTVTPTVFARWSDLESYDICQEPSPGVDDRPEPETVTVLDVNRAYALATDWTKSSWRSSSATLPGGKASSSASRPGSSPFSSKQRADRRAFTLRP